MRILFLLVLSILVTLLYSFYLQEYYSVYYFGSGQSISNPSSPSWGFARPGELKRSRSNVLPPYKPKKHIHYEDHKGLTYTHSHPVTMAEFLEEDENKVDEENEEEVEEVGEVEEVQDSEEEGREEEGDEGEEIEDQGKSLGCFMDDPTRYLPIKQNIALTKVTPINCQKSCREAGYRFAGLQNGSDCHCGNGERGLGVKQLKSKCDMSCTGDREKGCGGFWRQEIYDLQPTKTLVEQTPLNTDPQRLGCFTRDGISEKTQINDLTHEKCFAHCRDKGNRYAGLHSNNFCACGNGIKGIGKKADDHHCSMKCVGDPSQRCGSHYHSTVFDLTPFYPTTVLPKYFD